MKNLFNFAVMAMALCLFPIDVAAQDETATGIVENAMAQKGVMHDEDFWHTTVVITKSNGETALGIYKVTATFEGNYPVYLYFALVSSTDDNLFKKVPVSGKFESDPQVAGGDNAFMKFTDMFYLMFGKPFVDVTFNR